MRPQKLGYVPRKSDYAPSLVSVPEYDRVEDVHDQAGSALHQRFLKMRSETSCDPEIIAQAKALQDKALLLNTQYLSLKDRIKERESASDQADRKAIFEKFGECLGGLMILLEGLDTGKVVSEKQVKEGVAALEACIPEASEFIEQAEKRLLVREAVVADSSVRGGNGAPQKFQEKLSDSPLIRELRGYCESYARHASDYLKSKGFIDAELLNPNIQSILALKKDERAQESILSGTAASNALEMLAIARAVLSMPAATVKNYQDTLVALKQIQERELARTNGRKILLVGGTPSQLTKSIAGDRSLATLAAAFKSVEAVDETISSAGVRFSFPKK